MILRYFNAKDLCDNSPLNRKLHDFKSLQQRKNVGYLKKKKHEEFFSLQKNLT